MAFSDVLGCFMHIISITIAFFKRFVPPKDVFRQAGSVLLSGQRRLAEQLVQLQETKMDSLVRVKHNFEGT